MSRLISRRSISRLHNYYCTGDNTLQRKKKRKYHRTFAKRVFMLFNVFYVSRLLIIDRLSFTWHTQHLRLQMQIESRCRFFSLFRSFFTLSFFTMTCTAPEATNAESRCLFFTLSSFFHYLFKGFFLPCFFNETSYFSFLSCTIFYSSREHVT